jgi:ABC-2 type transport system permease protein
MKFLASNPVLRRELTSRMRTWRSAGLLVLYVGLLGLGTIAVLTIDRGTFSPTMAAITFDLMALGQFILLLFAAPGLTAGAISGERERQTLDLILASPLARWRIVWGKLLAALAYLVLLMIAALPLYGLLLYLGGLSMTHLLLSTVVQVVTALLLGALGLYLSTVLRRTIPAMVVTYAAGALATGGYTLLSVIIRIAMESGPGPRTLPLWFQFMGYLNPLSALFDAAGGPFQEFLSLYRETVSVRADYFPYWPVYVGLALVLVALLTWRTTQKLASGKSGV